MSEAQKKVAAKDQKKQEPRSLVKQIVSIAFVVLSIYLGVAAVVGLRKFWFSPPDLAADAYLKALHERDTAVIYLYSDMLGPRLLDMMAKSEMSDEERKQLWAKDYARWKTEFRRGAKAMDSLRRERELFTRDLKYSRAFPDSYRAEVRQGSQSNLATYSDTQGQSHHLYYRLNYPSAAKAPPVSALNNLRTGLERRIRSVVLRVQVRRRPDVNAFAATLMEWAWLDDLAFLFPFLVWVPHQDPSEMWMAGISFDVDKLTLDTF